MVPTNEGVGRLAQLPDARRPPGPALWAAHVSSCGEARKAASGPAFRPPSAIVGSGCLEDTEAAAAKVGERARPGETAAQRKATDGLRALGDNALGVAVLVVTILAVPIPTGGVSTGGEHQDAVGDNERPRVTTTDGAAGTLETDGARQTGDGERVCGTTCASCLAGSMPPTRSWALPTRGGGAPPVRSPPVAVPTAAGAAGIGRADAVEGSEASAGCCNGGATVANWKRPCGPMEVRDTACT